MLNFWLAIISLGLLACAIIIAVIIVSVSNAKTQKELRKRFFVRYGLSPNNADESSKIKYKKE